jgi:hypothetical protein
VKAKTSPRKFRIGERVEQRHEPHHRGIILHLKTSAGTRWAMVTFDAGYTELTPIRHLQRISKGRKKKELIRRFPLGKSGNPTLKQWKPKHQRRRSPFLQGGLPDSNRRRH